MRKQTKLVAVLSAAVLLAVGASMTSFAAQGWAEEGGNWVYYDKDGYQVTDTWKKSGSQWFYLDEDGYMATSTLIDNGDETGNTYYVDETGKMVTNAWVQLDNEDYYDNNDDDESESRWYYFQASGKAYKTSGPTSFKTINGKKYAFDENGAMLYGWVGINSDRISGDDAYKTGEYYCGDENDGARVQNEWRKLYVGNEGPARYDSEDDEYWFYFQNNGLKMKEDPTDATKYTKKINGKTYAFDDLGIMISDWHAASVSTAADISGYFGDENDGARQKGWFKSVPSKNIDNSAYNDDSQKWYYGNSDGTVVTSQVKSINGKKYGFDEKGAMMSGVYALVIDSNNNIVNYEKIDKETEINDNYYSTVTGVTGGTVEVYYFGDSEDGAMKTGNQTVSIDGDTYQFSFGKSGSSKGQGLNTTTVTSNNGVFYVYGKKIKANTDYRYQGVDSTGILLTGNAAIGEYLINTSGSIMKGSTYTDSEGRIYTLNPTTHVVSSWRWK